MHYRWDFYGLSTDSKPDATNEKVANGSTYYEADTSKLYVWYNDQWYEKEAGSSYELPVASASTLGGVKVGDGLSITEAGVLSSSGGGANIKTLTTADYNYPSDNPVKVGLWNLEDGWYTADTSSVSVFASRRNADDCQYIGKVFCVSSDTNSNYKRIYIFGNPSDIDGTSGSCLLRCYRVDCSTGSSNGQLYSGYPYSALTYQEFKGTRPSRLTTSNYNYPAGSSDGVALWLLNEGDFYINGSESHPVKVYFNSTTSMDLIEGEFKVKSVNSGNNKLVKFNYTSYDNSTLGCESGWTNVDATTGVETALSMYTQESV